jgi:hypothetical protein
MRPAVIFSCRKYVAKNTGTHLDNATDFAVNAICFLDIFDMFYGCFWIKTCTRTQLPVCNKYVALHVTNM